MHHRTPCTHGADDRADKRCTPCTSSDASSRARTAPLCEGLASASRPASPILLVRPDPDLDLVSTRQRLPHVGPPHRRPTHAPRSAKSRQSQTMRVTLLFCLVSQRRPCGLMCAKSHPSGRSANSRSRIYPKFSQKSPSDWPLVLSWIETSEHPWPITGNRSDSVEFTVNENSFCKFVLRRLRNE